MAFTGIVEGAGATAARRSVYAPLLLALFIALLISGAGRITDYAQRRSLIDFHDFYLAGNLVWRGEIGKAYRFATMSVEQVSGFGMENFMPWTYPPQFDLVCALLAVLPLGAAYVLFTAASLAGYVFVLRRIAGTYTLAILVVMFPAIAVVIACGQNGFLTGLLIGAALIELRRGRWFAGVSLGLMVIKPHLAVAFAVYCVVNRLWGTVIAAALTVAATSAFATLLLGAGVWADLLAGVNEAKIFLEHGMVSPYAALRSAGLPAQFAIAAQMAVAAAALAVVWLASVRLPRRQALGLTAIASLLISPYAYDYDLPILGIGLAALLPPLIKAGTPQERGLLYGLCLFSSGFGLLHEAITPAPTIGESIIISAAGYSLTGVLVLTWRILNRSGPVRDGNPPAGAAIAKSAAC
jgi:hypothetical protein